ncbi:TPA: hypothetical protein N0F65_005144 [Lagenidium giganteum]|uniref:Kinesin-like protein n=1 Tax=Lagenidium giganteum TaxID=4803 RepID=A0AAV2YXF8_9STRA|nr:TPA: hypothetical protein N0F65_005144 [Lagenidium giganteum]
MTRFGPPLVTTHNVLRPVVVQQPATSVLSASSGPHMPTASTSTSALPPMTLLPPQCSGAASDCSAETLSPRSTTSSTGSTGFYSRKYEQEMVERRYREHNLIYGKDVIQVPLKVEDRNNEYVNLVLSHREFDIMAVHIPQYDEMRPEDLIDQITRLVKESDKAKKLLNRSPTKNQTGIHHLGHDGSSSFFQARVLELEYELSRLNTKLAASRSLQANLVDENTLLHAKMRDFEASAMENEKLHMQNDLLHQQAVNAFTELHRMRTVGNSLRAQVASLSQELSVLRQQQSEHAALVCQTTQQQMLQLVSVVREREAILQESYLKEKHERQLITEKYHEVSGRIRVFCRLRPPRATNQTALVLPKPNSVLVEKGAKEFAFDKVFGPECTQRDVYEQIEPVVVSFADGYNACIMAYGQTGSGKTHTMLGNGDVDPELEGMIPRALQQVFDITSSRQITYKDALSVSMIEIYNDQIIDLLSEDNGKTGRSAIVKSENDITNRQVTEWSHVTDILAEGNSNRNIASTSMNVESSRSHALVFLHLESQHRETLEMHKSTLCLVDLAGSERISRSQVEGERLKETQHINKSLAALGDVVYALQHKAKHTPYRNSKLTYMLRDMLSGQAKTLLMLQLSPDDDDVEESLCSLNFGARASQVQMGVVRTSVESGEIFKLKDENRSIERRVESLEKKLSEVRDECSRKDELLAAANQENERLEQRVLAQEEEIASITETLQRSVSSSTMSVSSVVANASHSPARSPLPSPARVSLPSPPSPTTSARSVRSSRSTASTSSLSTPTARSSLRSSKTLTSLTDPARTRPSLTSRRKPDLTLPPPAATLSDRVPRAPSSLPSRRTYMAGSPTTAPSSTSRIPPKATSMSRSSSMLTPTAASASRTVRRTNSVTSSTSSTASTRSSLTKTRAPISTPTRSSTVSTRTARPAPTSSWK